MESLAWVLAGGSAAYAVWWVRVWGARRRQRAAELAEVQRAASADVAILGDQLRRLDAELARRSLDDSARADYWLALDAYDRATRDAARLHDPEGVGDLVALIGDARYAIECVRARALGRARPAPGLPCFFNPEHGVSVTLVEWTPSKRGTRTLSACRQCATRLSEGAPLEVRTVNIGSRRVPYWEVCAHHLPHRDDAVSPRLTATGPSVRWICDTAMSGDVDLGHYVGGGRHSRPPRAIA